MFMKPHHLIFSMILLLGTTAAVSSNNWFTSWIGLEINLMCMIPLMLININPSLSEASIKYFLTQALASTLLIGAANIFYYSSEESSLEMMESLIIFSLCLKAGVAPLHAWFPQVTMNLNWTQCLIMFTWQKLGPLFLLLNLVSYKIFFMSALSALIGALGGLNKMNLKLMMTYSSISHSGWILLVSFMSFSSWLTYFLIYCILSFSVIVIFNSNQLKKISDLTEWNTHAMNKKLLTINILSLGGLPPFLGFMAKMSAILFLMSINMVWLLMIFILSSLISLLFYYRVVYSSLMNTSFNKLAQMPCEMKSNSISTFLCFFLNILTPMINLLI